MLTRNIRHASILIKKKMRKNGTTPKQLVQKWGTKLLVKVLVEERASIQIKK